MAPWTCVICQDPLSDSDPEEDRSVVITNCGHLFHRECIINWIKEEDPARLIRDCPYCRSVVVIKDLRPVFGTNLGNEDVLQDRVKELELELGHFQVILEDKEKEMSGIKKTLETVKKEKAKIKKQARQSMMAAVAATGRGELGRAKNTIWEKRLRQKPKIDE